MGELLSNFISPTASETQRLIWPTRLECKMTDTARSNSSAASASVTYGLVARRSASPRDEMRRQNLWGGGWDGGNRWPCEELCNALYPLPTAYYLLPTTYYLLPTIYYLLPTTCYLLPSTYYLLPTTYYLLSQHMKSVVTVASWPAIWRSMKISRGLRSGWGTPSSGTAFARLKGEGRGRK